MYIVARSSLEGVFENPKLNSTMMILEDDVVALSSTRVTA